MTELEAIDRLKTDIFRYADFTDNPNEDEFWEAFDMAITSLRKRIPSCVTCKHYYKEHCANGKSDKCTKEVAANYYCDKHEDVSEYKGFK